MSAPFFLPFNFQPSSVAVKTGSYTIPAGKYARVTVEVDSGGIFTIDAVSALTSAAFVNVDSTSGSGTGSVTYTVPTGFKASVSGIATGESAFSVNNNGDQLLGTSIHTNLFNIGPAGTLTVYTSLLGFARVQGLATPSNATNRQATFWLPTGTIINGSGNWRAVVEEYNEIT